MIKGPFSRTSVGTLVERKTRFVLLCKMDGNGAEAALEGFTRQMKRLPQSLRKSMTYDRGLEMACHPELARRLKIDIWFCDPYSPSRPIAKAIACRAMPGREGRTKTPADFCASSCPKARTSVNTLNAT